MKIIVTGSIAYDYLMSFPGKFTEQILPEHLHRLSLSFLVDSMDKRRGGCAPNIAYTLALLGERPLPDGDGRRGLRRLPAVARGGRHRHVAGASRSAASSPRRSSAAPTRTNNQIASFYTGAMADAGQLSFRGVKDAKLAIISPNDPGAMVSVCGGVPDTQDPVHLRSRPAVLAHVGRGTEGRHQGGHDPVATRDHQVREPGARYIDFVVPGLLGMNLMGSGI